MAKRFEKAARYTRIYRGRFQPCPYCKSKNIVVTSDRLFNRDVWSVGCADCGDGVFFRRSIRQAVNDWNLRAIELLRNKEE